MTPEATSKTAGGKQHFQQPPGRMEETIWN